MKRIKFLLIIIISFFTLSSIAQNASDMLSQHKEWVRKHTADVRKLSDEQLLIETARTVYSSCNDSIVMEFLFEAEKRFGIAGLSSYATNRMSHVIDRNDSKARQLLRNLAYYSSGKYGKNSYVTSYIYFFLIQGENWETLKPIAEEYYQMTSELCKSDKSCKNEELLLHARVLHLIAGKTWEDPSIYKEFLEAVDRVVEFYKMNDQVTEIRTSVYRYIGMYGGGLEMYPTYYGLTNDKSDFYKQGKSTYGYLSDNNSNDKPFLNFYTFLRLSIEYSKQLLHPNHPDVINHELEGYEHQVYTSLFHDEFSYKIRLKNICDFFRIYYGENSLYLVELHNFIRRTGLFHTNYLSEIESYDKDLSCVSKFDDGKEWLKERTLNGIIFYNNFFHDSDNTEYVDSLFEILDSKMASAPVYALSQKIQIASILQNKQVRGYETSFDDVVQQYFEILQNERTWDCVALGKSIALLTWETFKDYSTYLAIQQQIVKLEKELSKDNPVFFACEYLEYGKLISRTFPLIPPTLEGDNNPEELYEDIIKVCENTNNTVSTAAHIIQANYYFQTGSFQEAKNKFIRVKDLAKESSVGWELDEMINCYLMQCYAIENKNDSVKIYADLIEQQMDVNFEANYSFFEMYIILANTFLQLNEKERSRNILTRLFESYNHFNYPKYDATYVAILRSLIQLYGNIYGDMNKCSELLDRCINDYEQNEDLIDPTIYLEILKMYYDLWEFKEPGNTIVLNDYLGKFYLTTSHLLATSKNAEQIFYNYVLYFYSKMIGYASREQMFRNGAIMSGREVEFNKEWQTYCDNIKNNVIPDIESRLESASRYPQYHGLMTYMLAYAYEKCIHDYKKAEELYKEVYSPQNAQVGISLADMYVFQQKYEQADSIYSEIDEIYRRTLQELNIDDEYLLSRANFVSRFLYSSYKNKNYGKAKEVAQEYLELITKYINKNFNFFAENERENFLTMYGAGGTPLQMLTPYIPEITGNVYNTLLKEKGLLLRTSKNIEKAIYATNNPDLISSLDSIKILRAELSNIQTDNQMANQNEFIKEKYKRLKEIEQYIAVAASAFLQQPEDITWEKVRNKLKKNEVAIEYVCTSDTALYALVLRKDSNIPQFVELMDSKSIYELTSFMTSHKYEEVVSMLYSENKFDLYAKIWKPIEKYLDEGDVIFYSCAGFLNSIAFNAILSRDGKRLMDCYDLRQVTSTSIIAKRESFSISQKKTNPSIKFYGAICYDDDQIDDYNRASAENESIGTKENGNRKKREADNTFPFLSYSYKEIINSKNIMEDNNIKVDGLLTDTIATEIEFRTLNAKSPTILHISTHGYYFNDYGKDSKIAYFKNMSNHNAMTHSGLVLSNAIPAWYGEVPISDHDNIISSAELSGLDLANTELAVLSACQTGLGLSTNDGVMGLQRGLKLAGVKSLCVSLWNVMDDSTSSLMQSFYSYLIKESWDYHKAFKDAIYHQRSITNSPYDWASFVLIDSPF